MAFSYDSDDLATPLNRLRFLVQDTSDEGRFFEDAEIEYAAEQETNLYRAAAELCRVAATKVLKDPGFNDEIVDYDPEEKSKTYMKLADSYDKKANEAEASMSSPGTGTLNLPTISTADPAFTRDLHFS